ncbi:MAG TPA: FAD-dependent oxidoreductase [Caulobacteraceae bacterium]
MIDCDVLVIGAGIAGASIACELAAHAKVVIVEREERAGYHTSGRSAAMFIESYGPAPVRRLTSASRAFFDAPPAGFSDYPLLTPRPALTIARADQSGALEAVAAQLTETGGAFREVSAADAKALVPALRPEAAVRALIEPDSADIDVDALLQGFLRLGRSRGVELMSGAAIDGLERAAGRWQIRLADGRTMTATTLINAAGAWGDAVAQLAGAAPIGLVPKRRTVILVDPPAAESVAGWPTVVGAAEDFYFKPQSGLILASPCDETPSAAVDAAPEEWDIAVAVERLQTAADIPVRRIAQSWAGLRTFTADHIQAFGFDTGVEDFFWFAGQGGFGMQTAPAAARLGAALALRRPAPSDLMDRGVAASDFAPGRFG